MREIDLGEYSLRWPKELAPTPGGLAVCQALFIQHFDDAGLTGFEDRGNLSAKDVSIVQIATKKVLDDPNFLEILDEVFDVSKAEVVSEDEKYSSRNKIKLSEIINAPVIDGSGVDRDKLIVVRSKLINFLSVG